MTAVEPGMRNRLSLWALGWGKMKELVEYVAKSLVDDPSQVRVTERVYNREIRITLSVAEEDMGRVIGRNGRVANAIRTLLRVAASHKGSRRVSLDIL